MSGAVLAPLHLLSVSDGVCDVFDAAGQRVGCLKRIGAVWKFKAIGQSADGQLEPGGGPLTARHNLAFGHLDAAVVNQRLLGDEP